MARQTVTIEPFTPEEWQNSYPATPRVRPERTTTKSTTPANLARIASALDALHLEKYNYEQWRDTVFGIHHETEGSDEGLELALEWSARSSKHNAEFLINEVWPYVRSNRSGPVITGRSIFAAAAAVGWIDPDLYEGFEPVAPRTDSDVGSEALDHLFLSASEFVARRSPGWIVKGVIPDAAIGIIFGEAGSGKSFFTLDIAAAIARGVLWRDRKVQQRRVAYIVAEGAGTFGRRLLAIAKKHGITLEELNMFFFPGAPNFLDKDAVIRIGNALRAEGPFGVIIIDTLARVTVGGDENSAEDMGVLLANCAALHAATGAVVILVHHSGKDQSRGMRGSSALNGGADFILEVLRGDNDRVAKVTKQKDGEDGLAFGFRLETVAVGTDEDGEPVTSCVLEATGVTKVTKQKSDALRGAPADVFEVVREELLAYPDGVPREEVIRLGMEAIDYEPTEGGRDLRRDNVTRALNSLLKRGRLVDVGGFLKLGEAE